MSFSIFGQYVTNISATNSAVPLSVNETNVIRTLLITSASMIKAMALGFMPAPITAWNGSYLEREINAVTNGERAFSPLPNHRAPSPTMTCPGFNLSYSNDNDFAYAPALTGHFAKHLQLHQHPNDFYPTNLSPAATPDSGRQRFLRPTGDITNRWLQAPALNRSSL